MCKNKTLSLRQTKQMIYFLLGENLANRGPLSDRAGRGLVPLLGTERHLNCCLDDFEFPGYTEFIAP